MSLLNERNENSSFCQNHCFLVGFYSHLNVKIIPQDHFCANINLITSKLEYCFQKLILCQIFWPVLGNEEKIMICSFFKFSVLEHLWGLKWIAWVDIWVVLIYYSFQSVWVDLEGEFEKWTKCTRKMDKMQRGIKVTCFRCHPKRWNLGVQRCTQGENHLLESTVMTRLQKMCDFFDKQI